MLFGVGFLEQGSVGIFLLVHDLFSVEMSVEIRRSRFWCVWVLFAHTSRVLDGISGRRLVSYMLGMILVV